MKSRSYIELPLFEFRRLFPDQAEQIPKSFDEDLCYIVRYDYIRNVIEFGYREDAWCIS